MMVTTFVVTVLVELLVLLELLLEIMLRIGETQFMYKHRLRFCVNVIFSFPECHSTYVQSSESLSKM